MFIGLRMRPIRTGSWHQDYASCGYESFGAFALVVAEETFFHYGPNFGAGDWVGCGVHLATRRMFFTRNGTFLSE